MQARQLSSVEMQPCAGCQKEMTSRDLDYNICEGCDRFFCYVCEKNFVETKDCDANDSDSSDEENILRYCPSCNQDE